VVLILRFQKCVENDDGGESSNMQLSEVVIATLAQKGYLNDGVTF
jgi:hypothetical protein